VANLELPSWRSQVQQELAALNKEGTQELSDVKHTLQTALQSIEPLIEARGIEVDVEFRTSGLLTPLPVAALRQVFVTALMNLLKEAVPGRVKVTVGVENRCIKVLMTAFTDAAVRPVQIDFIQEILNTQGRDAADTWTDNEGVKLSITLPSADLINVLVIDDNADLVHFYQRYTTGTQYNIVPAPAGIQVPESIVDVNADIIVLDIMLPDRDGWGLLKSLHANSETRYVPVIVCSVVREEELALALGARLYVSKPIGRQEFLRALQTALYPPA
jgi:CheY-like chemotaxis protein